MNVLVIDIGGTNIKFLASGQSEARKIPSGPHLTPRRTVAAVKKHTSDWKYDVISIGFPGPVLRGEIVTEPFNLGKGWIGFNFRAAFGRPVKLINDAAMQALGSYKDGTMLFLGFGTGLGSALVVSGNVVPMELAHLPLGSATYEDYLGLRGLEAYGKKKWRRFVDIAVAQFKAAFLLDEIVIGGGNAKKLKVLPDGCRAVNNANAFAGGFRLWEKPGYEHRAPGAKDTARKRPEAPPRTAHPSVIN
jgi:predicted NBD/HSP70 family sugar kinase